MAFMGDAGGVALARGAGTPGSSLHTLNVQNNRMGAASAAAMVQALAANANLTTLLMDGNVLDYAAHQRVLDACRFNRRRLSRNGGALGRLHRVLAALRRDKASFTDVLFQRDQAALQDQRSNEYLEGLLAGRKAATAAELRVTDELAQQLNKLKLDTLELQSNFRGVCAALQAEEAKRDGGVLQLQTQLESDRAELRALKRKIAKEQSALQSRKAGTSTSGSSSVDFSATGPIFSVFPPATSLHSHSQSFSAALGPSPAEMDSTSVATAEQLLALTIRQRDAARADNITALNDLAGLIASFEAQMNKKRPGGQAAGSAGKTPGRGAAPTPRRGGVASAAPTPRGAVLTPRRAAASAASTGVRSGAASAKPKPPKRSPSVKRLGSHSSVSSAGGRAGSGNGSRGPSSPGSPRTNTSMSRAASRAASRRASTRADPSLLAAGAVLSGVAEAESAAAASSDASPAVVV